MNRHELVRRYQEFDTVMGGYFYEDWPIHWSTVDDAYRAAFAGIGEEGQRNLRAEVERILDTYQTDDEVLGLLRTMDFGSIPAETLGLTPRAWLEDLRDRLPGADIPEEGGAWTATG